MAPARETHHQRRAERSRPPSLHVTFPPICPNDRGSPRAWTVDTSLDGGSRGRQANGGRGGGDTTGGANTTGLFGANGLFGSYGPIFGSGEQFGPTSASIPSGYMTGTDYGYM
jgi:hypothetical protein